LPVEIEQFSHDRIEHLVPAAIEESANWPGQLKLSVDHGRRQGDEQ
jgi:hypothetical protein